MEHRWLLSITVDTLVDEADGSIDDGDISLRDAIAAAAPGETIDFDASLDGGTLLLTLGELSVTKPLTVDASSLAHGLTIDASGNDPTLDENRGNGSRIFNIDDGDNGTDSPVTISGLTLTGGDVRRDGGVIRTTEDLTVTSSTISANSAWSGGGIWASGDLTVISSTISGNSAGGGGGGIWASGDLTVTSSTISGNSARGHGGGIWSSGDLTVTSSTISGNSAGWWRGYGGGIRASGDLTVTSSTISGNSATKDGGIWASGATSVTIDGSIVAGNTANERAPDIRTGTVSLTVRYTLIGDNTGTGLVEAPLGAPDANGNLIGAADGLGIIAPLLGALADNGGPTKTHALMPGSPALGAGDPNISLPADFDQRGTPFVRVSAGRIDMGAFEGQAAEVPAIDLVVDTLVDEMDGDYSAGELSLREAVLIANFRAGPDVITFDQSLGGGTVVLMRGQLGVFDELAVDATALGAGLIIDASGSGRIFEIDDGNDQIKSPVAISGLTLTGGEAVTGGGAIRTTEDLTVTASTISRNSAGSSSRSGHGGGIWSSGDLTVTASTISGNSARHGGGIWSSGTVTVTSSTISGNSAGWSGGGIWSSGGLTVTSSTISGNSAGGGGDGGGGIRSSGDLTVTSSTISGNSADGGGGILASGDLTVTSSTISGNSARSNGGGGIRGAFATSVTIDGSIVAGNTGRWAPDINPGTGSFSLTVRHTLIGDNTGTGLVEAPLGAPDANGNLIGAADGLGIITPLLGALADNGGPTKTHALMPGSPALGAGDPNISSPPDFDQRGKPFVRVSAGRIDMGAFEWQVVEVPAIDLIVDTLVDEMDGDYSAGDLSLREAVLIANFRAGPDAITFDPSLGGRTVVLMRGQLGVFDELAVDATALGDGLILDASGGGRIFAIDDGNDQIKSPVAISGLTLTGGDAAATDGGAIRTTEDLTVTSSTISGNSAGRDGGGIWSSGDLTVTSSTISGNSAGGGGGIWSSGDLAVTSSTISGNSARRRSGGGIWSSGDLTVTSSTISGNSAGGPYDSGGGISSSGDLTVTSSTITGNSANKYGGGILASGDTRVTIDGSIVAGNTTDGRAPDIHIGTGTDSLTVRYALIGDNRGTGLVEAPLGAPDANGNLIGAADGLGIIAPLLGALADHGGPTKTHALLAGSPAIDAGDLDFSPPPQFDQRGNLRLADGDADGLQRIDTGAFEVLRGDVNGDGQINGLDVDRFVDLLVGGLADAAADSNGDGRVNGLDVDWFVDLVVAESVSVGIVPAGRMQDAVRGGAAHSLRLDDANGRHPSSVAHAHVGRDNALYLRRSQLP